MDSDEDDEDDDDAEGAGETERGDEGVFAAGVGVRGGDGGRRAANVSVYKVCKDKDKCWRNIMLVAILELLKDCGNRQTFLISSGNSPSYCRNSLA